MCLYFVDTHQTILSQLLFKLKDQYIVLFLAFVYGTYALAGASVFGVGMLCYYGLGMSKGMSAADRAM